MKKILTLATSAFLLSANSVAACSCFPTTPEQSLENASTVFSGRVVEVVQRDRGADSRFPEVARVKFEVEDVWKGTVEENAIVLTPRSSAACGYSFAEGEEYLVYASGRGLRLRTGLCSGTKRLSEAQADLAMLEEEQPMSEDAEAAQLQQNRQKWAQQNLESYRYTLQVGCFCPPEVRQPVVVEVRNGKVASIAAVESGKSVNPEYFQDYDSVAKLFEIVEDAIAQDAYRLDIAYDETLGYPTQINIDYNQYMADEERYLTIKNLEPIP